MAKKKQKISGVSAMVAKMKEIEKDPDHDPTIVSMIRDKIREMRAKANPAEDLVDKLTKRNKRMAKLGGN